MMPPRAKGERLDRSVPRRRAYHSPTVLDLAHDSLHSVGRLRLRVTGHSMAPFLHDGDTVWVEPLDAACLRQGDLVLVRLADDLLTHRLVAVDGAGWHTKGDNVSAADPPVAAAAILGRVVAAERRGQAVDYRQTRWAIANRVLGALGYIEVKLPLHGSGPTARLARRGVGVLRRMSRQLVALPEPGPAR